MSKKATPCKSNAKQQAQIIREHAGAIIADVAGYDTDTRASIARVLESNDPDLTDLVIRAEAGDTIWDLTNIERSYEKIALRVVEFTNSSAPDFITDAVMDAILRAGEQFQMETPFRDENETKGESSKVLAKMFGALSPAYSQRHVQPDPNSREALAGHIAAIMAHPLTPFRLFNEIGDFLCDESSELIPQLEREPEYVKRILDRGTCGYILCPGGGCDGRCTRQMPKGKVRK